MTLEELTKRQEVFLVLKQGKFLGAINQKELLADRKMDAFKDQHNLLPGLLITFNDIVFEKYKLERYLPNLKIPLNYIFSLGQMDHPKFGKLTLN